MIQRQLREAFHHGEHTIGNMFNHAVKWAGQIDQAFNVGKRIYGALQPAIQDLGGADVNWVITGCIGRYEQGREEVIGYKNKVQAQLSRLREAVPEFDS